MGRINAAIWGNTGSNGAFHTVTVTRSYKDGDVWKQSDSFGRDDLPLVARNLRDQKDILGFGSSHPQGGACLGNPRGVVNFVIYVCE